MVKDLPELLTVKAFAAATGKHPQVIRDMCKDGRLPADKVGKSWYIPRDLVFRNALAYEAKLAQPDAV